MTLNVSDATFEAEVLKSTQPVVVDFHATWCGPCIAMAPALNQLADELKDKVKVVKIDVDANPKVTAQYGIRAMPTLLVFKGGEVTATHTGAIVQKVKLAQWIGDSTTKA